MELSTRLRGLLTMELKPQVRLIDLALLAGRKRQSPRTGFVHLFLLDAQVSDTIPLYENFCFALTLFRLKTTETVLEGKELFEKLLAFQTAEGNFPIYLHEFPKCWDPSMGLRIAPILVQTLRHFGSILGADLKEKMGLCIDRILHFSNTRQSAPVWQARLSGLQNHSSDFTPVTAEEWFEWLITAQLLNEQIPSIIPYDEGLQAWIGEGESQEKREPTPWPIEWVFAERRGFSERLVNDHPKVLRAASVFPISWDAPHAKRVVQIVDAEGVRFLWRGNLLHSLSAPNGVWEDNKILFSLPEAAEPGRGDLIEAALFCNLSSETEVFVGGKRGMVFKLGESVEIITPTCRFQLIFTLAKGSGDFALQISRGNRPAQTAAKGAMRFEAFDWQISIRTLRRSSDCQFAVAVAIAE